MGASWRPGTAFNMLRRNECLTKSNSRLWLMLASPYTNSYLVQFHVEVTHLGFSFFGVSILF